MAEWFYQTGGQHSGPVDSRELRRLAKAGIVTPETLVRHGAGGHWVRAEKVRRLFQQYTAASSPGADSPASPPIMRPSTTQVGEEAGLARNRRPSHELNQSIDPTQQFSATSPVRTSAYSYAIDPRSLTSFLVFMLWISFGMEIVSIVSDAGQLSLLDGAFTEAEAAANDARQRIVGLAYLGVFIVTGIAFLMWIYRANLNCRAFGAEDMKFTPGWSVGYYFVPVLNLIKPYQSMKEIWQASHNPANWQAQSGSALLGWWWALWLMSGFLGQIVFRLSIDADSIDELQASTSASIFSSIIGIFLCCVALNLVKTIAVKQEEFVGEATRTPPLPSTDVPEVQPPPQPVRPAPAVVSESATKKAAEATPPVPSSSLGASLPRPPPLPEPGEPSRGVSSESPKHNDLRAAAVNGAAEESERIWSVTWAAIIVGSGTVLLLLWAVVFRGGSEPQQEARIEQPARQHAASPGTKPEVDREALLEKELGPVIKPAPDGVPQPTKTAPAAVAAAESKSATASNRTGTQVYEEVVGSTVTIHSFHGDTPIGHGSGFILYPGEVIVTNEHVIRGASSLTVRNHRGTSGKLAVILNVDAAHDIAVLPVPSSLKDAPGIALAPNLPRVGETVYAIGAPQGLEFTFTRGIVSQVREGFLSYGTVIQTDVSVSPGSSGGPLVNGAGLVVGINTLGSKSSAEAHNLNFAVAMSEIGRVSRSSVPQALTDLAGYRAYTKAQEEATKQQQLAIQRELDQKKREEEARRADERRREEERTAKVALLKKWRQVRSGLSREQVRDLLGEPTRIEGGTLEKWKYPGGGYVIFYELTFYYYGDPFAHRKWEVSSWSEPGSSF